MANRRRRRLFRYWRAAVAAAAILSPQAVAAADAYAAVSPPATAIAADEMNLKLAEPDFTLISLPTSLRLPQFGSAFRVTHRFTQPLNATAGDVASNLFGLDSGAQIGLEYRFGIVPNAEVGIHRTSDKTIELFSQYGVVRQTSRRPVDISVLVSVEGSLPQTKPGLLVEPR